MGGISTKDPPRSCTDILIYLSKKDDGGRRRPVTEIIPRSIGFCGLQGIYAPFSGRRGRRWIFRSREEESRPPPTSPPPPPPVAQRSRTSCLSAPMLKYNYHFPGKKEKVGFPLEVRDSETGRKTRAILAAAKLINELPTGPPRESVVNCFACEIDRESGHSFSPTRFFINQGQRKNPPGLNPSKQPNFPGRLQWDEFPGVPAAYTFRRGDLWTRSCGMWQPLEFLATSFALIINNITL